MDEQDAVEFANNRSELWTLGSLLMIPVNWVRAMRQMWREGKER